MVEGLQCEAQIGVKRRNKIAIAIGVVFVLGIIAVVEFKFRRPVGEGPAGPKVDPQLFQTAWTRKNVLLLGLGDSVTRGLGAKSPEHSYFGRLIETPDDEWPEMRGLSLSAVLPNLKSLNLAVSGSTSPMHQEVIRHELETQPDDVFGLVAMTTGGNDLIHSYGRAAPREGAMYGATLEQARPWIQNFETRLASMIAEVTEKFPGGCEIYLATIYDPTDGVGDAASIFLPPWPDGLEIHARYNEVIREVGGEFQHVHIVPLYEAFLGHGSHCRQFWRRTYDASDPHYWYWDNIEDPNTRGYDAIRRVFLNSIVANSSLRPIDD